MKKLTEKDVVKALKVLHDAGIEVMDFYCTNFARRTLATFDKDCIVKHIYAQYGDNNFAAKPGDHITTFEHPYGVIVLKDEIKN